MRNQNGLFTSRRTTYEKCTYWKKIKDEAISKRNQLMYEDQPTGTFLAKEESDEETTHQNVNNSIMVERTTVTLKTYEDISNLEYNDKVEYRDKIWVVNGIRKSRIRRTRQFSSNNGIYWFLELRSK